MSKFKKYRERRTSRFNFDVPRGHIVDSQRQAYTYDDLYETYPLLPKPTPDKEESDGVSIRHKLVRFLLRVFPIIQTLRKYRTSYILSDLIAGLSVSFLHVPQGLAYGLLASLSPVSGLYTSVIPVMMYTLFGTCMHVSMGTNSILSLITAEIVERELKKRDDDKKSELNLTLLGSDEYVREAMEFKLGVAMLSAFVCGCMLLAMGVLRLGFITSYMPSSFVGGFTTAAAVHIATSQVGKALHIHVTTSSGLGRVVKTYIYIFQHITSANIPDLIITTITLVLIAFFAYVNPKLNTRYKFDVPINLVVVILGTIVSYQGQMEHSYGIDVVGPVAAGFPSPTIPDFSITLNIIGDAFVMALVVFSMTISMAMLMSKMHSYDIDANQELIAYGLCNISSAPFMCHANSVSPSRTMLLSNSKVKSMLHGIPTTIFLLSVILGLGYLFQDLPIAVLAAVVLGAVYGLLAQVKQLPSLWKINKTDFVVWVSTFCVTTFVGIGIGLAAGVAVSAFAVVVNNQNVQGVQVVKAKWENIYIAGADRLDVTFVKGIRIFYFPAQLYFFNAEIFKRQLYKQVLDPTKIEEMIYHLIHETDNLILQDDSSVRCIILDCSAITFIDLDGISMLKMVVLSYHRVGVQILMARCHPRFIQALERSSFFYILPRSCVFYDLHDAMVHEHRTREGVSVLAITPTTQLSISSNDTESDSSRAINVVP